MDSKWHERIDWLAWRIEISLIDIYKTCRKKTTRVYCFLFTNKVNIFIVQSKYPSFSASHVSTLYNSRWYFTFNSAATCVSKIKGMSAYYEKLSFDWLDLTSRKNLIGYFGNMSQLDGLQKLILIIILSEAIRMWSWTNDLTNLSLICSQSLINHVIQHSLFSYIVFILCASRECSFCRRGFQVNDNINLTHEKLCRWLFKGTWLTHEDRWKFMQNSASPIRRKILF